MSEKKFNNIKRFITVLLSIFIIIAFFGIVECFYADSITPYQHALLWGYLILYNLTFLFITRKTTLSDDYKKD